MNTLLALLTGIIFASQPLVALAQAQAAPTSEKEPTDIPAIAGGKSLQPPPNTVNCFDYYHFGSVQVDVTPSVASAVSGTSIRFTGTLKNANPYPIVDGSVYVKVFKARGNGRKDFNGPDVVDQFYAPENISIPAGGNKPVQFSWNVPSYAVSGQYRVATFFTVSDKFNLLGLPFTDDVVGNSADFKVVGEQQKGVSFKKDAVTVNGEAYHFAAFPPREKPADTVTVEATLVNTTAESVTVPVSWTLNQWSGNDKHNFITTKTEQVTIPAGKSAKVSFAAEDTNYPVYLLQGVAKWHDTLSIINVRFVREGKDRLRINLPAVTSYPLKSGEQTTLFSCLHNAGASAQVPNGRLELLLTDASGRAIQSYTYTGDVTGAMVGVAKQFTPKKNYDIFSLEAKLYQGRDLVDASKVTYDCHDIDPSLCTNTDTGVANFGDMGGSRTIAFIFGGLLAFVVIVGLIYVMKLVRKPHDGSAT